MHSDEKICVIQKKFLFFMWVWALLFSLSFPPNFIFSIAFKKFCFLPKKKKKKKKKIKN